MSGKHITEESLFSYLTGEASFQEMADTEAHLAGCVACTKRKTSMAGWLNLLSEEPTDEEDQESLARARNRFEARLSGIAGKKPAKGFWNQIPRWVPSQIETRRLVPALILFLCGIWIGNHWHSIFRSQAGNDLLSSLRSSGPGTWEIMPPVSDPDKIEIRFRNVEERTILRDFRDPDVQSSLAYALMTEKQDHLKMRTMDYIQPVSQDDTMEEALLHILANDPNPGLRYRAIKLLRQFPFNDRMKSLLIRVLFLETNPAVRIQVTEKLIQSGDPEVMPILQKQAEKDETIKYVLEAENTRKTLSVSHE